MKSLTSKLTLCIVSLMSLCLLTQCSSDKNYTTTITSYAADNLDLKAVTALAAKVKTAEEFETKLNDPTTKINNLDLNEDNEIDYIKVTEINDTHKGFSLTVEVPTETGIEEQEIATIQYDLSEKENSVQTHGNRHIYGPGYYHYYRPYSPIFIGGYFGRDHTPYLSRYGHNNKPSNFTSSKPIPSKEYSAFNKAKAKTQGYGSSMKVTKSSSMKSSLVSPNKSKVASKIKAPLKSPSTAQKAFQKTSPSKYTSRTKSKSSSSFFSSKSRYGSSSSSRSRSSFGGGK